MVRLTSTCSRVVFYYKTFVFKVSIYISELQARYWAHLFGNLQRAVDEIYMTCESDENVSECKVIYYVFNFRQIRFIRGVACDRVGHDIVLNFLEHYGLLGKNLSLFMLVNLIKLIS